VQEKHRGRARCAQASQSLRTYPLRLRRERLLLQGVHRIERSNTQECLIDCRKECVQEFFSRLEVAREISGGLMLWGNLPYGPIS
jgi:hypothetical protein